MWRALSLSLQAEPSSTTWTMTAVTYSRSLQYIKRFPDEHSPEKSRRLKGMPGMWTKGKTWLHEPMNVHERQQKRVFCTYCTHIPNILPTASMATCLGVYSMWELYRDEAPSGRELSTLSHGDPLQLITTWLHRRICMGPKKRPRLTTVTKMEQTSKP